MVDSTYTPLSYRWQDIWPYCDHYKLHNKANLALQYWVTFAFLTVFESAVSAVYWFRKSTRISVHDLRLTLPAFYYTFKFVLILWMALPQTS